MKSDVLLLACVFEKFIKVAVHELDFNPLYCASLPGYTWQCGLKFTGINLQTLQDKDLILTLESNKRGVVSSVMSNRFVKSDDKKRYYIWMQIIYMATQCLNHYLMMKLKLIKMLN